MRCRRHWPRLAGAVVQRCPRHRAHLRRPPCALRPGRRTTRRRPRHTSHGPSASRRGWRARPATRGRRPPSRGRRPPRRRSARGRPSRRRPPHVVHARNREDLLRRREPPCWHGHGGEDPVERRRDPLGILAILQGDSEGAGSGPGVELPGAKGLQCPGPVQGLGDPRRRATRCRSAWRALPGPPVPGPPAPRVCARGRSPTRVRAQDAPPVIDTAV